MDNPFTILGLPTTLSLQTEEIDTAWRERASSSHPDMVAGEERSSTVSDSASINEARQVLLDPASRLAAWIRCLTGESPSASGALNEDLMSLFQETNGVFGRADGLLKRHREASTALGKAVLAREAIEVQLSLQDLLAQLGAKIGEITECFPRFEENAQQEHPDFSSAVAALSTLRFLKKWESGCRERLLSLIEI